MRDWGGWTYNKRSSRVDNSKTTSGSASSIDVGGTNSGGVPNNGVVITKIEVEIVVLDGSSVVA